MKRVTLLLPLLALAWVDWVVLREVYVDWYVYPGSRGEQYFLLASLLVLNLIAGGFYIRTTARKQGAERRHYLFDRKAVKEVA